MASISDISDEELIQQFMQGDLNAFDSLYYRHIKSVFKRVRYVIPETDVEDVTQEVFIAALHSLPSFRGDALFSTWLRTLTNHKVTEFYRKRSRKKETMQVDLDHAERQGDQNDASKFEDQIALRRALLNLPEQYREVILLRFADGMKFIEIAGLQNQNPEATKSLYRRAISALRKKLDVNDD